MYFTPKDYTSKITYLYCWAYWNNCYYSKVLYWFYTVVVVGDNLGNSWNSNSNFGQRNQLSIEQMKRLLRGNDVAIDLKLLVTFWIKVKCYIIFMIVSSMLTVIASCQNNFSSLTVNQLVVKNFETVNHILVPSSTMCVSFISMNFCWNK